MAGACEGPPHFYTSVSPSHHSDGVLSMMGTPEPCKKQDWSSSGLCPHHMLHMPETRGPAFPGEARPSACKPSPFLITAQETTCGEQPQLTLEVPDPRGHVVAMETSVAVIARVLLASHGWGPGCPRCRVVPPTVSAVPRGQRLTHMFPAQMPPPRGLPESGGAAAVSHERTAWAYSVCVRSGRCEGAVQAGPSGS